MKVNLISLGCSKNLVDSEVLLNQISENRIKIVKDPALSDIVIINTCGFINDAKDESLETIFQAVNLKNNGKIKKVFVMGCLSERYKEDLKKELPEVDEFFGVNETQRIIKKLGGEFKHELLGERFLLNPRHFAYLKISEGCDHPCSFCAIPIMRGKHKSKKMNEILSECEALNKKGVKELILIAQDTTSYGIDIYGKRNLSDLLKAISGEKFFDWIRIMYAYPSGFPIDVLETMASEKTICNYLDIPVQHISDKILKSMRRGITKKSTYNLLEKIKLTVPGITLRTTLITGYPGETEEDFEELKNFVKDFHFDRLGVFTYSQEENTFAFDLGDPVPERTKRLRRNSLMRIQKNISAKKNSEFIGKTFKVLIDEKRNGFSYGRTEMDAPEIDNEVIIKDNINGLKIGKFYDILINDFTEYELYGNLKK